MQDQMFIERFTESLIVSYYLIQVQISLRNNTDTGDCGIVYMVVMIYQIDSKIM